MNLPVLYDHTICDCHVCELRDQRDRTYVPTQAPPVGWDKWNRLLIVGEGPGNTEARTKVPLVGPSGKLLDKLLDAAGIDRQECAVGNATSCQPAPGQKGEKAFHISMPNALPACAPRLFSEIASMQPRVIVALGAASLAALTGEPYEKAVRISFTCAECGGAGKWSRFQCQCGEMWEAPWSKDAADCVCGACGQAAVQSPRNTRCKTCEGRKTYVEVRAHYRSDWNISWVAGGVFDAEKLGVIGAKYIVPTYHPSFLLRPAKGRAVGGQFLATTVVEHLMKAKRLLTEDRAWSVNRVTTQDPEVIAEYTQYIGPRVWYSLDIETDSKEPRDVTKIRCFGIHRYTEGAGDASTTIVVDTEDLSFDHPAMRMLVAFLLDADAQKEGQNFSVFDMDVVERLWGVRVQGLKFDLLLGHKALYPDEPHHLHHIAFTFSDAEPWKPPKSVGGMEVFETKDELHEYNASDAKAASHAGAHLRRRLREDDLYKIHDIDLRKAALCRDMNQFGIPILLERQEKIGRDALQMRVDGLAEMHVYIAANTPEGAKPPWLNRKKEAERVFNPNSTYDLPWALYAPDGPCRLICSDKTESGGQSTNKGALKKYADHTFVKLLKKYRKGSHIYSNFITGPTVVPWEGHPGWGRMLMHWKPSGAKTGRYTSEDPNAQNWNSHMRWMVVPPPGYRIFGADSSQGEYRLLAGVSGDPGMYDLLMRADEKRKLEPEYDPHSFVAQHAFGVAYTNLLLKDPSHGGEDCRCQTCQRKMLRDVIKRCVYGMSYGGGAPTIRDSIMADPDYDGPDLSVTLVQSVIDAFYKAFQLVRKYQTNKHAQALEEYEIKEPILGRHRVFPFGDVPFTECVNWDQQAGLTSIIDLAIDEFLSRVPHEADSHLFAVVHDGIYGIALEDHAESCADLLAECMTCEVQFHQDRPAIPFPATGKTGADWAEVG